MCSCWRATSGFRTSRSTNRYCRRCASDGQNIVLAVSPGGLVEIASHEPKWDAVFGTAKRDAGVIFEPDVAKLDLTKRDFISLDALRAHDSGRIVGPKAAKLGELKAARERFAPGVAIPFGLYREAVLDRPYRATGKTVYQWMVLPRAGGAAAGIARGRAGEREAAREIYAIVANTDPGAALSRAAEGAMAGVRRDLAAAFSCAPIPTSRICRGHRRGAEPDVVQCRRPGQHRQGHLAGMGVAVYAACAWRQAHMKGPEHVYPAVLLLQTVPADSRRDDHAGRDERRYRRAVGRGQRGSRRRGRWAGRRIGAHRSCDRQRAADGERHGASAFGPARNRRRRATADVGAETLLRTDEVRR